jgi:hypothetical protein
MSAEQASTGIEALRELGAFPLVDALFGRRSRRSRWAPGSRMARA